MRKSLFLIGILLFLPVTVFAKEETTVITTTIPATYTLTIPSEQHIKPNAVNTPLTGLKVSGELAPDQQVKVSASIEAMKNKHNEQAPTLSFALTNENGDAWNNATWSAQDASDQKNVILNLKIEKEVWNKATSGRYEGKIIFSSEIETIE